MSEIKKEDWDGLPEFVDELRHPEREKDLRMSEYYECSEEEMKKCECWDNDSKSGRYEYGCKYQTPCNIGRDKGFVAGRAAERKELVEEIRKAFKNGLNATDILPICTECQEMKYAQKILSEKCLEAMKAAVMEFNNVLETPTKAGNHNPFMFDKIIIVKTKLAAAIKAVEKSNIEYDKNIHEDLADIRDCGDK